jgi:uncharacterized protein YdhG (YjbR/CyaY superfamily)
MARTGTIDAYLAAQPAAVRRVLRQVRDTIRKALPGAEETISYQLPAYRLSGRIVLYFGGWAEHYALYPGTNRFVSTLRKELAPYEVSKGTIRFPLTEPVPVRLIARIAKLRAKEVERRTKKKKGTARRVRASPRMEEER